MIHLCVIPSTTEVDHGPPLFYHLPARWQRHLLAFHRLPGRFPLLARRRLPRPPRAIPPRLRPGLHPQGQPPLRQAGPPPAPHPLQGHGADLLRPALLRPALHDRLGGRRRGALVLARLRRPLLGFGPGLRPRPDVLVSPGTELGEQQHRRHDHPPRPLPEHLLADEHHQPRDGTKNYVATTVAGGCCLGAALAPSAGAEDLQAAYAVFRQEARDVQPDYRPKTVNTDGWAATRQAWSVLFPLVVILRCFLHGWLNIRSRGKLSDVFSTLSEKVWNAYHAPERRSFSQRMRRLWEWAREQVKTGWVLEQVQKLCGRAGEYGEAYRHPGGHRTSNMLDRQMRAMNRYFDDGQHLHGTKEAGGRHCRAWALLHNFRSWSPQAERDNGGWRSPAERLNRHRYHDNWLENLLVSASLAGYRR